MDAVLIFLYTYVFVLGACLASFINVVIYRVPLSISVAKGRSFCPRCNSQLKFYDLIPILSWATLKGKCRYCGEKISIRYPLIELLGGVLSILCFNVFGITWMTLIAIIFTMILIAISMIDFDTLEIPNELIIALILCAITSILVYNISISDRILGFFIISVPMYLLIIAIPNSFGGGDVKLIAACGLLLGYQNTILAMFIAIIIGGFYAIYLLVTKKVTKQTHIAFGPYICLGAYIALLYGNTLITWYLSLFNI